MVGMACCGCCKGACCYEFEGEPRCSFQSYADCKDLNGKWQGPGTSCAGEDADVCPCKPPADPGECQRCIEGAVVTNDPDYCCEQCPKYPVECFITGGLYYSGAAGGYTSLELQCVDANGIRVFDWRDRYVGTFTPPVLLANGLAYGAPNTGCEDVLIHTFNASTDAAEEICSMANMDYCKTVGPNDFTCCDTFEGGGIWCDNPLGTCEDDPP